MKKLLSIILAIVMAISLFACKNNKENKDDEGTEVSKTRIVTDALGRKVEIPSKVDAIVPLGNTPRMITYLGLADKVVGYGGMDADKITPLTAYAYVNKDKWNSLPKVGTDAMGNTDYYPEEIISSNPDVILCTYTQDVAKDIANKTGIPVIAVGQGTLFGKDYEDALRIIGEVCGVEDRAEKVISYINTSRADLNKRTANIADAQKPTALSAAATFKGIHGIEGVRLIDPILTSVNANNIARGEAKGNATVAEVDKEQILAWNPDYIFCDYGGVSLVLNDAASNPKYYKQLKAFNNGQIYQYPSGTSYYENIEISLANCYFVGSVLYPEQFKDVNVEKKANEIFKFFLGEDDYMSVLNKFGAGYKLVDFGEN